MAACAFLVTLAALLRFQVYESVLVLPLEQGRTYRMAAQNASYMDMGTLTPRTGVPIVSTTTLSGDASAGNENVAVWAEFTSLTTPDGERVDYHERRTAFDRRTGMAVDCCGAYVDEDARARQEGLAFRLPYRAEPRSYPMYDTVLRRAVPLRFERVEEVQGITTYRYTYTAGPIKIEDLPGDIPGRVLGLPKWRSISVSRYAQVTRTLWVEPESGLTVKAEERHRQGLRTPDGIERRVSLDANLVMPPDEVAVKVGDARAFLRWVLLVRDLLPGVFLLAGLAVGLLAVRPRRSVPGEPAGPVEPEAPDDSGGPGERETPDVPGGSAEPEDPDALGGPEKPETSDAPDGPAEPEDRETAEKLEEVGER
ncbi:porin PorA family protein [Planobispora siamensis]|uniref:DUF3068 domain-containing protein n=1 Tax=Planobispora siamensis TaxID=936338 RepID=A0A8J3S7P9_9ACTN|nr:DUF3068 domain-containing protein [Planobispora siamensis]GIH89816.1 hypothetical protein Psi01_04460 [Planobispora siamensis]